MKTYIMLCVALISVMACHTTQRTSPTPSESATSTANDEGGIVGDILLDLENDGSYEMVELPEDLMPRPRQGTNRFLDDIFGSLNYPPSARENNIQGKVLVDIWVNPLGTATQFTIEQSVSPDIDQEVLRVIKNASHAGFTPLVYEGNSVPYRIRFPMAFRM